MPALILASPIEIDGRLNEFGIAREELIEIVHAMVAARAECTDNDPAGARGWSSWRHGTRRAREIFRSKGWLKDETDQVASIIHPKLGMRVTVANTDDATGIGSSENGPQNRSQKGAATDRMIEQTHLSLFETMKASSKIAIFRPKDRHSSSITTFYLCVFNDGDEVRAEFSCPIRVENGFFGGFSERIILVGPGAWPPAAKLKREKTAAGSGSEFDIPVRRK